MRITEMTFQTGQASELTGAPIAGWARAERALLPSAAFSSIGNGPGNFRQLNFKGLMQTAVAQKLIEVTGADKAQAFLPVAAEFAYGRGDLGLPPRIAGLPYPEGETFLAATFEFSPDMARVLVVPENRLGDARVMLARGTGGMANGMLQINVFWVFALICGKLGKAPIEELRLAYGTGR